MLCYIRRMRTAPPDDPARGRLWEVVRVFTRLGITGFGGPAVHLALQEEECVHRRRWLDRQRFLDLLAGTNLIPGPNSTEMAIHLGRVRAGWPGLVAAGVAFVTPAALVSVAFAVFYLRFGQAPAVEGMLEAIRPAVLIVVADALIRFGRSSLLGPASVATAAASAALALVGVSEILLVVLAAMLGLFAGMVPVATRFHAVPLAELAWVFGKIGATLFGSGYVLIAYLRSELAVRGWLSDAQLLDAVAVGQVTPGPVSSTATFVGYVLAGAPGAVVATIAMFLPSFVFVAATGPLIERWRTRPAVRRALDVVNATVVGLIAAVLFRLVPAALDGPFAVAVLGAAAAASWIAGLPGPVVMLGAAALGFGRAWLGSPS